MNPFGDSEVPPREEMIKRRERTRKRTRRIVFAALAAGSAALATLLSYQYGFWGRANRQVDQTAPGRTAPLVNAREGPRERPTPELLPLPGDRGPTPPEAQAKHLPRSGSLPPLDRSDALVRELALSISSRPELVTWLASDELIRRFATSVDNVADGLSPRMHVPALAPEEPFRIIRRDGRLFIDPASYRRYDAIADVFSSLPTSSCATRPVKAEMINSVEPSGLITTRAANSAEASTTTSTPTSVSSSAPIALTTPACVVSVSLTPSSKSMKS